MIPDYPQAFELDLKLRQVLHPLFQQLPEGISEFTFANLYLFRKAHNYKISRLSEKQYLISGDDGKAPFFMLPFGLPDNKILKRLFNEFTMLKCISQTQKDELSAMGYIVSEDRDNFDYLYLREDLSGLSGRKFHKKRNLIKGFLNNHTYEGKALLEEHKQDALQVLETWRRDRDNPGDYNAAKEALEKTEELQLCGGIYYVKELPVAYSLGEELAEGKSFAIHFEKAVNGYKGIWQFVNQAFASILPEKYSTINREQDLGNTGLRQAKLSYKPVDFVRKYRAFSERV